MAKTEADRDKVGGAELTQCMDEPRVSAADALCTLKIICERLRGLFVFCFGGGGVRSWNRLKWPPPFLTIVVVGLFPSLLVSCMNQIEGIDQQHLISCRTCKNPRIQKTKNKKQKY